MKRFQTALLIGGLLVAGVVVPAGCGGDGSSPQAPGPPADVTIEIVANNFGNSYSPNPATVRVGQRVAWHNAHNQVHTATQDGGSGFDTGNISPGATSAAITFSAPDTLGYHCTPHPTMVATLRIIP